MVFCMMYPACHLNKEGYNIAYCQYSLVLTALYLNTALNVLLSQFGKKLKLLSCVQPRHGLYPLGSSICGIFQARILEWVAIPNLEPVHYSMSGFVAS